MINKEMKVSEPVFKTNLIIKAIKTSVKGYFVVFTIFIQYLQLHTDQCNTVLQNVIW